MDAVLKKYLLPRCAYTAEFVESMSIQELAELTYKEQYITLLTYIFSKGLSNVDVRDMSLFIDWMLNCDTQFETGLIAYIWCNSAFNNLSKYPTHSKMLSAVDNGCNRETLCFLWDVAKSGDIILANVIEALCSELETPKYIKLLSYIYICSGCSNDSLTALFQDIHLMEDVQLYELTDKCMLFTWSDQVVRILLEKGYTMRSLYKKINDFCEDTFVMPGKEFPVSKLRSRLLPVRVKYSKVISVSLTRPKSYRINYAMWDPRYIGMTSLPDINDDKYITWFNELSDSDKATFKQRNPIAYQACVDGKFQYVEPLLDSFMQYLGGGH